MNAFCSNHYVVWHRRIQSLPRLFWWMWAATRPDPAQSTSQLSIRSYHFWSETSAERTRRCTELRFLRPLGTTLWRFGMLCVESESQMCIFHVLLGQMSSTAKHFSFRDTGSQASVLTFRAHQQLAYAAIWSPARHARVMLKWGYPFQWCVRKAPPNYCTQAQSRLLSNVHIIDTL